MSWKTAKDIFYSSVFPSEKINKDIKITKEQSSVMASGNIEEIKKIRAGKLLTASESSCSHVQGKEKHNAIRKQSTNVMTINGYKVDAWEKHCLECNKTFEMVMVMFNDEENVCAIHIVKKDKKNSDALVFVG